MTEAKTCVGIFHLLLPPVIMTSQSLPTKYLRVFCNETSSLSNDSMQAFSDERHHYPTISCGPCLSKWRFYLVYKLYILTLSTFCIYTRGGHHWRLRGLRFRIPLKPWHFQASSFQLLNLENLLRWSLFTFIYNRSRNMNFKNPLQTRPRLWKDPRSSGLPNIWMLQGPCVN